MALVSKRTFVYIVGITLVLTYGITGTYILGKQGQFTGFNPKTDGLVAAVYFTVESVTTVGYGDIVPVTSEARIFVIILLLTGLSVFLSAVATIGGEFLNGRIENLYGRVSKGETKLFKDHIVLIGTNSTNLYLAERLKENHERFIIITSDKLRADKLRFNNGYYTYVADATADADMKRFQLDKAKTIIIDVKDSSRTIYVLLVAKGIAKDTRIIAIAPNDEAERHIRSLNVASSIINPSFIAATEISRNMFKK